MKHAIPLLALLALSPSTVFAQPVVTNCTTSIYAVVPDPESISFGADGALYAGRDNSGSGGGYSDAVKIHRVAPGGAPVAPFGNAAVTDPDALIVDVAGVVSGVAGSVLVGGDSPGKISRITPDGTVTTLFGPSSDYANPSGFAFDLSGRLLFTTYDNGRVYASSGGAPVLLFALAHCNYLEVDAQNRIVVNSADETRLRLYTAGGVLSNANFAAVKAGTPLARARGGVWGADIYAVGTGGALLRVGSDGAVASVGSGFATVSDLRFGPDGALYASEFSNDRVYRFAPPSVPGAQTTIYARVPDPEKISFAPDGTLYAGRDNSGSGGGNSDAVKIHRIGAGGTPVAEFGNAAIPDPDAVLFDATGAFSGVAGSVIVGGVWSGSSGALSRVEPDGTVAKFFGPSSAVANPGDLIFDGAGRLLFTDSEQGKVFAMTGGIPTALLSVSMPMDLTLDAMERIMVSSGTDSALRLYNAAGAPINMSLATAQSRSPLARGPGGFWGVDVYFVGTNGNLQCVDTNGVIRTVGAAFGGLDDFAFGPDGALYASQFSSDVIWRIAPAEPPRPVLLIGRGGESVIVFWPVAFSAWKLEWTQALVADAVWNEIPPPYQTNATHCSFSETSVAGARYFRLRTP